MSRHRPHRLPGSRMGRPTKAIHVNSPGKTKRLQAYATHRDAQEKKDAMKPSGEPMTYNRLLQRFEERRSQDIFMALMERESDGEGIRVHKASGTSG